MSEHSEQVLVFQWAAAFERIHPELRLLHAVQNWAGVKSPREGVRRKREGVKSGVPDLHLPVARGGYHSLYIEMKNIKVEPTATGVRRRRTPTTPEQRQWHGMLEAEGNAVEVCYSAAEAQAVLADYLGARPPR